MTDWPQIVREHGPMVWSIVYRLLNHDADAADCFQRTFLSALVLSRTQTVRNWPGLLQRLGTARALESLRQRLRQSRRLRPLLAEVAAPSGTPEPDQAAAVRELSDHLREALAQLVGDLCIAEAVETGQAEDLRLARVQLGQRLPQMVA